MGRFKDFYTEAVKQKRISDTIRDLLKQGKSKQEIIKMTGASYANVYRLYKEMGGKKETPTSVSPTQHAISRFIAKATEKPTAKEPVKQVNPTKVTQPDPVVAKPEEKSKDIPIDKIISDYKSGLKSLFKSESWMSDDEPEVQRHQGKVTSITMGFRDLGKWDSRPGEEDDDYAEWSEASHEKYKDRFVKWAKSRPWYDSKAMSIRVFSGEKSWAYFEIAFK